MFGDFMARYEKTDVAKELEEIYRKVDFKIAKYGELSDEAINEIIPEYRRKKRTSKVIE